VNLAIVTEILCSIVNCNVIMLDGCNVKTKTMVKQIPGNPQGGIAKKNENNHEHAISVVYLKHLKLHECHSIGGFH